MTKNGEPSVDGGILLTVSVLVTAYNWSQMILNGASPDRVTNLFWAIVGSVGVIYFTVIFVLSATRARAWRRLNERPKPIVLRERDDDVWRA